MGFSVFYLYYSDSISGMSENYDFDLNPTTAQVNFGTDAIKNSLSYMYSEAGSIFTKIMLGNMIVTMKSLDIKDVNGNLAEDENNEEGGLITIQSLSKLTITGISAKSIFMHYYYDQYDDTSCGRLIYYSADRDFELILEADSSAESLIDSSTINCDSSISEYTKHTNLNDDEYYAKNGSLINIRSSDSVNVQVTLTSLKIMSCLYA